MVLGDKRKDKRDDINIPSLDFAGRLLAQNISQFAPAASSLSPRGKDKLEASRERRFEIRRA